jgi:hypothetical protein
MFQTSAFSELYQPVAFQAFIMQPFSTGQLSRSSDNVEPGSGRLNRSLEASQSVLQNKVPIEPDLLPMIIGACRLAIGNDFCKTL